MELFDLTKLIFSNNISQWQDVSYLDKKKHIFMMNRFASIAYPMQTNMLQHVKCDPIQVMNFWKDFMSKRHNKVPHWMYIKGKKQKEVIKEKKLNISNNTIIEYCKFYNLSLKDVQSYISLFANDAIKDIKEFESLCKQNQ